MAKKITDEEIKEINRLYRKYGTYSDVAKHTGRAASTVKKYVDPDFEFEEVKDVIRYKTEDFPTSLDPTTLINIPNMGDLCELTNEEIELNKILWEEILI